MTLAKSRSTTNAVENGHLKQYSERAVNSYCVSRLRGDALFCAHANLRVDVEVRCGLLARVLNYGTQLLRGREARPDRANPSANPPPLKWSDLNYVF